MQTELKFRMESKQKTYAQMDRTIKTDVWQYIHLRISFLLTKILPHSYQIKYT